MLEAKKQKKEIGFQANNGELVEALAKLAQSTRVPINRLPLSSRGSVEKCKKHTLSLPVALPSRLRSSQGSVNVRSKVSVTCQELNAPMASEPVDRQLDQSRLLFGFLAPKIRNL